MKGSITHVPTNMLRKDGSRYGIKKRSNICFVHPSAASAQRPGSLHSFFYRATTNKSIADVIAQVAAIPVTKEIDQRTLNNSIAYSWDANNSILSVRFRDQMWSKKGKFISLGLSNSN
jgi:hypothetical protein